VDGRLSSRELGLEILVHEGHLRFRDPATGTLLPTRRERADTLVAEVERLRTEVERLRRGSRES